MRQVIIKLLLLIILLSAINLSAQDSSFLPVIEPSYRNQFSSKDLPFTSRCIDNVFMDREGRLWLTSCSGSQVINNQALLQFDGYEFTPVELIDQKGENLKFIALQGITKEGRLYGLNKSSNSFFIGDTPGKKVNLVSSLPISSDYETAIKIQPFGQTIYFLKSGKEYFSVYGLKLESLLNEEEPGVIDSIRIPSEQRFINTFSASDNDFWILPRRLPFFHWDRQKKQVKRYEKEDFLGFDLQLPVSFRDEYRPTFARQSVEDIYIVFPNDKKNQVYKRDPIFDHFVSINQEFNENWEPQKVFQDEKGNLCFLFKDEHGEYGAILQDSQGTRYDFSAIVQGLPYIRKLVAQDFFHQLFITTEGGLFSVGINNNEGIRRALQGKWVAGLAELPNGQILTNVIAESKGWYSVDKKMLSQRKFDAPHCSSENTPFGFGMKQQVHIDKTGNYWFIQTNKLIKYSPMEGTCQSFSLGNQHASLFTFLNDTLVAFIRSKEKLLFYNIEKQEILPFEDGITGAQESFVRDLYVDPNGILWVPTNYGLWKVDFQKKKSEVIGLDNQFADRRITSIFPGENQKLWLGTYYGGLHIFDIPSGKVEKIIDRRHGLSSNAIMSMVRDLEGDYWVGTEYGINLVSSTGEVLTKFHKNDGLSTDFFERFDPLLTKDGHLIFGSRNGLNIIDPTTIKQALRSKYKHRIFLTEINYFDQKKNEELTLRHNFEKLSTLKLPARHRFLKLKFALNNYIQPELNRYVYKLEGLDKNWIFLGSQPELNFNSLPPGKYKLLIRGADFKNKWAENTISIPIYAKDFFYRQPWFYALIISFVSIIAYFWIRQLRMEKTRLEAEVKRRTQKIEEDKTLIETQAKELQQLDELKSRFFTNISHELRTPITLITAPIEQIIRQSANKLEKGMINGLQLVLNNGRKLTAMVEELLDLSKLEANKLKLEETPTPLVIFCRQIFRNFLAQAQLKQIHYRFHTNDQESSWYWIDRPRLEKIINNLLSNALKFTSSEGQVSLSLQNKTDHIQILVQDTGRGISSEDLPHIFERYFQTKEVDAPRRGGTGIGLALSSELTRLMNGKLEVESEAGKGSLFTLTLPLKPASPTTTNQILTEENPGQAAQANIVQKINESSDDKPSLLIVEDNLDMQQLIDSLLGEEYNCLMANNGAEALEKLQKAPQLKRPKLIISDIMMPRMDGYKLLDKLKNHSAHRKIPVIMLTSKSADEDKLKALRLGVDDYLTKPFSPEELQLRVRKLITNARQRKIFVQKNPPDEEMPASADDIWLQELEKVAQEALDRQIDLSKSYLADQMAISERHLLRRLKSLTGLTIQQYTLEIKLHKARRYLDNRTYSTVAEVAYACGFNSPGYFSRVFEKHFGKRPSR